MANAVTSVIYLTDTRFGQQAWEHPSARHRCYHFADALHASGIRSSVVPMERVSVSMLKNFEHAIFHRPALNKRFTHALECCRKASVQVHADYDDLIFHSGYADQSPLFVNGNRSLEQVARQFEDNSKAAKQFDSFVLSTGFLRQKLIEAIPGAQTSVVSNSLPRTFVRPGTNIESDAPLTIGYFPGSNGHGEDFNSIKSVLKSIVGSNVRLLVVGRMDRRFFEDIEHVRYVPFSDYKNYLQLLAYVDVSIAPLTDSLFNQSKSAVKLIESVGVATPIVASANPDMRDHSNSLTTLVEHEDEWFSSLSESLFMSREKRADNGTVSDELGKRYSVKSRIPALMEHLQCAA